MAISGLGALLLIGALTGIFRTLDFSTPRLVNGTPPQLAWIRILVCLTALIFTVIVRDYYPAVMPNSPNSRFFLMRAFRAGQRSKTLDEFLASYVQRSNRNLAFGSAISSIEVQQWRWNYAVDPNDPRLGWVIAVYPFDATAKASPPR